MTDENLRASLQTIKEWREYADKTSLEKWTATYIEPVLDTLGFGHHREKEGIANVLILFPDVDRTKPMSICYVVPPGEDINCTIKGKHWAEKIIRNLRKHNFEWGILTDGIYWRIYHTKESTPYETYVEVNLESILNNQDYPAFQIFYFFFWPDNFIKKENGECKFDNYKEESLKTTEYIEDNLRAAIEREEQGGGVLQTLCLGYLDALRKETHNEEERLRIYGGAILYLFRLLFLFYSTARDLLKNESIEAFRGIVRDSFRFHKEGGAQSNSYDVWISLQDLFAEIDLTYNGGLFNPHESNLTQFIEETRITDPFISEVVFGLGYYQKSKGNFVPIEYRDLSVRHLGSLYEGLLEHNLFIAEEDKVVRKTGNKVRFISVAKAGRITRTETIIEKGKVYFSEDAKERKLTGSYYTPEDVVEYIVKNTVDALLGEKKQELMADIEPVINEINSAINESVRKRLELFIEDMVIKFIEEKILLISVLDPTMGSGHFLVNATNHIANFIVDVLNDFPGYNPKISSAPAYWRRRVVEDCIYGVDLNPLAVELAKLCLWITTAFKEKPLSFLNHHLKQGNALVGVRISELEKHLEKTKSKYDLFFQSYINSIKQTSEGYKEKLNKLTEAREDIEEKKETLAELDEDSLPYKHLCNLFTNYLLGELKESDFLSQIENWKKPNKTKKLPAYLNSKDFFHWDLEFSDVFYGNNPGFDCVIGNPPYADISNQLVVHRAKNFFDTSDSKDLYTLCVEQMLNLSRIKKSYGGMIVPLSLTFSINMRSLRRVMHNSKRLWRISSFDRIPDALFGSNVRTRNSIILMAPSKDKEFSWYSTQMFRWFRHERPQLFNRISYYNLKQFDPKHGIPKVGSQLQANVLEILEKNNAFREFLSNNKKTIKIYYKDTAYNWITVAKELPPVFNNKNKPIEQTKYGLLYLDSDQDSFIALAILNSILFFWYWLVYGDGFDVTKSLIESFPINPNELDVNSRNSLDILGEKLHEKMKKRIVYKINAGKKIGNYNLSACRDITDKVDKLIIKCFQLPDMFFEDISKFCDDMIKTETRKRNRNHEIKTT